MTIDSLVSFWDDCYKTRTLEVGESKMANTVWLVLVTNDYTDSVSESLTCTFPTQAKARIYRDNIKICGEISVSIHEISYEE